MIDDNDIKKLGEVFATETRIKEMFEANNEKLAEDLNKKLVKNLAEVFVTKTDLEDFKDEYKEEFSKFLTKLDEKTGKEVDDKQEATMLKNKVDRHDRWINKIADKVNVKLES